MVVKEGFISEHADLTSSQATQPLASEAHTAHLGRLSLEAQSVTPRPHEKCFDTSGGS